MRVNLIILNSTRDKVLFFEHRGLGRVDFPADEKVYSEQVSATAKRILKLQCGIEDMELTDCCEVTVIEEDSKIRNEVGKSVITHKYLYGILTEEEGIIKGTNSHRAHYIPKWVSIENKDYILSTGVDGLNFVVLQKVLKKCIKQGSVPSINV